MSGDVLKLSVEHGLDERPQFRQLLHPGTLYLRGSDELLLPSLQVLLRLLLKISALECTPYANHTTAGHLTHRSPCMGFPRRACRPLSFHQEQDVKNVSLHSNHALFKMGGVPPVRALLTDFSEMLVPAGENTGLVHLNDDCMEELCQWGAAMCHNPCP